MSAATDGIGAAVYARLEPELRRIFKSIPAFGSISFTVHFQDQEPVRIETSGTISMMLRPKGARA